MPGDRSSGWQPKGPKELWGVVDVGELDCDDGSVVCIYVSFCHIFYVQFVISQKTLQNFFKNGNSPIAFVLVEALGVKTKTYPTFQREVSNHLY